MPPRIYNPSFAERVKLTVQAAESQRIPVERLIGLEDGPNGTARDQGSPEPRQPERQRPAIPDRRQNYKTADRSVLEEVGAKKYHRNVSNKLGFSLYDWQTLSGYLVCILYSLVCYVSFWVFMLIGIGVSRKRCSDNCSDSWREECGFSEPSSQSPRDDNPSTDSNHRTDERSSLTFSYLPKIAKLTTVRLRS